MSESPLAAVAELGAAGWVVGGAIRDDLLGRPTTDFDVTLLGDPGGPARALARRLRAHVFALSDAFGAWRVVARDRSWQIDFMPLTGDSLEQDLARRDLTINALARPLDGAQIVDLHGGLSDLRSGRLRMVSDASFREDPLRTIRLVRFATELGFRVEDRTGRAAAMAAPALADVAPERVFAELRRILIADDAVAGLRLMEGLGVTDTVLPELVALRGLTQSDYHHRDVHGHTLEVLDRTIELERDPGTLFADCAAAIRDVLDEPLADELTRGQALRFGALLHDIAKPDTRAVGTGGRVSFLAHDVEGAALSASIMRRLRASERLAAHVAALTRHHLRLGFLVHERPLDRRALYAYLAACEPVGLDVTLLSVADRLATLGRNSEEAIAAHLELVREIVPEALRWRERRPRSPVDGDRLQRELGLPPGPQVGRLLEELSQASFAGEIVDEAQALRHARRWLTRVGSGPR